MLKYFKQILHGLVLLITGLALIGVNVIQSNCMHSKEVYLEVRVVPAEKDCPCDEGCSCCSGSELICEDCCHTSARHTFYKVTDSTIVEKYVELESQLSFLPATVCQLPVEFLGIENQNGASGFYLKIHDVPPSPELLCTFLC